MKFQIKKATKEQAKARIGLIGPSGSGKTWTALTLASALGTNIVVIDTENASASKYADSFDFSVLVLDDYAPQTYVEAIRYCEQQGFDVIVIDSLSHAWVGKGGALEQVDQAAKRLASRPNARENTFGAWREVTPHHNALVDALVRCNAHLIATMRAKTEYIVEQVGNRATPRKVGLAPVQRDGMEYEFDIVADMNQDHDLIVTKTRCVAMDGLIVNKPGPEVGQTIKAWLSDGVAAAATEEPPALPTIVDRRHTTAAVSPAQHQKLAELFEHVSPLEWADLDELFMGKVGKPLDEATKDEARQVIAFLLKRGNWHERASWKESLVTLAMETGHYEHPQHVFDAVARVLQEWGVAQLSQDRAVEMLEVLTARKTEKAAA